MNHFRTVLFFVAATTLSSIAETNRVSAVVATNVPSATVQVPERRESAVSIMPVSNQPAIITQSHSGWLEHRIDTVERNLYGCYDGLTARLDEKVSSEVRAAKNEAEEEYTRRYEELKDEQSRFMGCLGVSLSVVGVLVALFGIGLPIFNEWRANSREKVAEKQVQTKIKQYQELMERVSKLREFDRCQNRSELLSIRAEVFFQLARVGFEQYKANPIAQVLEIVVKQLSRCIQFNIEARDGKNLKHAISLLNAAMNKDPGPDRYHPDRTDLPSKILDDREIVAEQLETWPWNVSIDEVKRILAEADIDEESLKWSVSNLEKVIARCSGNDDEK